MVWIFALAATALLLFAPRRIRKIGFVVWAILLTALVVIVLVNRRPVSSIAPPPQTSPAVTLPVSRKFDFDAYERDKKDQADPDAKTRIATTEIRFGLLTPVAGVARSIESVRVRVFNDSPRFPLTDFTYYLQVEDCPQTADDSRAVPCTTVYDQHGTTSVTVPSNQARDVVIPIAGNAQDPPPYKLLGKPRIVLQATDTRSYGDAAAR